MIIENEDGKGSTNLRREGSMKLYRFSVPADFFFDVEAENYDEALTKAGEFIADEQQPEGFSVVHEQPHTRVYPRYDAELQLEDEQDIEVENA